MGETTVTVNTSRTKLILMIIASLFVFGQVMTIAQEIDTVDVVDFQVRTAIPGENRSYLLSTSNDWQADLAAINAQVRHKNQFDVDERR